jgi:hypothetical protein
MATLIVTCKCLLYVIWCGFDVNKWRARLPGCRNEGPRFELWHLGERGLTVIYLQP